MGSFEDEIADLFAEHQDAQKTKAKAQAEEEKDRQEFLRKFRDKLLNTINPVLVSIKDHPSVQSSGLKVSVVGGSDGFGSYMKVEFGNHQEQQLKFNADYKKKRVVLFKGDFRNAEPMPHKTITLEEVTESLIQDEAKKFLREVLSRQ